MYEYRGLVFWGVLTLLVLLATGLERRRKRLGIGTMSYWWGYFQGLFGIAAGVLLLCDLPSHKDEVEIGVIAVAMAFTYLIAGFLVIQRRRSAWICLTIMTLMPVLWIVNYIYGKNRWGELQGGDAATPGAQAKRPPSLSVICVLEFIAALYAIRMLFSPIDSQNGPWYPPYLALAAGGRLVCMVGLWMMKRWAVYAYIGFVALNQVVLLATGVWHVVALVLPAVVIFFALRNAAKMT